MASSVAFGRWVQHRRKMLDLTQQELADRLDYAFETVRKLEAGTRRPSRELAPRLARVLAVDEADIPAFMEFARTEAASSDAGAIDSPFFAAPPPAPPPLSLPAFRTSFVGRGQELLQVCELLLRPGVHLLTLIGPPGIGKTRLALAVAAEVHPQFPDGVHFVPLAALENPAGLGLEIARALALRAAPGGPALAELKSYLARKELLLVLDNFEQITAAASLVGELVDAAPGITILVTSRNSLGLYGERRYPVPPLALPPGGVHEAELLRGYEAVELFFDRAQAVRPGFALRDDEVADVAAITRQLDGLPLAIELAAARARVLRPAELLARLGDKLRLLAGGPVDLPPRQQTLRGAIAWSYDLLSRAEQVVFERMAVFVDGARRDAIDVVTAVPAADLDDLLAALLDKSLLRLEEKAGQPPRFWMLWTIRAFAAERLAASGDDAAVRARHAAHYLGRVEAAAPLLTGPDRGPYLEELEGEHDNLRVALDWYLAAPDRVGLGVRLAGLLDWYWYFGGFLMEGRSWLERTLDASRALPDSPPVDDAGRALSAAGWLAILLSDCPAVQARLDAALAVWGGTAHPVDLALLLARRGAGLVFCEGDERGQHLLEDAAADLRAFLPDPVAHWHLAFVLDMLADIEDQLGHSEESQTHHHDSLTMYQALADEWGIGQQLGEMGRAALYRRDYAAAQGYLEQALELDRRARHPWNIATTLRSLGDARFCPGDVAGAGAVYAESLALFQTLGDRIRQIALLRSLGHVARAGGRYELARHYYRRALLLLPPDTTTGLALPLCLAGLAGLAIAEGMAERGALLLGAAAAQAEGVRRHLPPLDQVEQERYLAQVADLLSAERLAARLATGRALTREVAVAFALSSQPDPAPWLAESRMRSEKEQRPLVVYTS